MASERDISAEAGPGGLEPARAPLLAETGVRQSQKEATRNRVMLAARELFDSKGYEGTTIREIARHAGVSGTFTSSRGSEGPATGPPAPPQLRRYLRRASATRGW